MRQISEALHQALVNYLAGRPWHEVNDLIQALAQSKQTANGDAAEPKPSLQLRAEATEQPPAEA